MRTLTVNEFFNLHITHLDAVAWLCNQPDLATAWQNCQRADWMLWALVRLGYEDEDKRVRLLLCDYAWHVLPAYEQKWHDNTSRRALATARRFLRDEVTLEQLEDAVGADAAWAAEFSESAAAATAIGQFRFPPGALEQAMNRAAKAASAVWMVVDAAAMTCPMPAYSIAEEAARAAEDEEAEQKWQADALREVLPNIMPLLKAAI